MNKTLPSIFNCSNDMALAANVRQYFPPKRIMQMESELSDLSKLWDSTRFAGPWGWSLATKQRYIKMGIDAAYLPSDEWLNEVRMLSSRQYACDYIQKLLMHFDDSRLLGKEMRFATNVESAMTHTTSDRTQEDTQIYKSPWSSSGRGVFTSHGLSKDMVEHKLRGFINTQGGFVVDKFHEGKTLDFAMEFYVNENHSVDFLGYSVFYAAENGAYGYNLVESQNELKRRIDVDETLLNALIEYHKEHLGETCYHGPVGIDMIKTSEGKIHPVIEINMRMNMGILALLLEEKYGSAAENRCSIGETLKSIALTQERERGFQAKIEDRKLMIIYKNGH